MDTPEYRVHRSPTSRHDDPGAATDEARTPADAAGAIGNANLGRVLESPGVQRSGGSSATLDESVARAIEERRGGGAPLPGGVRDDMEQGFGADFSDVRVHDDHRADELSESVDARAFTVGNDIFFRDGTYDTASTKGRELLAHELTHVVQQDGAEGRPTTVSDPDDHSEQQADAVAEHVVSGAPGAAGGQAGGVARQPAEEEEELQMARQAAEEEEELQMARQPEEEELQMARQAAEEEEELQMARQPEEEEELQMSAEVGRQAPEGEIEDEDFELES